jgi:Putative Actinobacterial Holin-X, holin superfamily III
MIHPLLRLVATQPQLLADHAEAYAGLVGEEFDRVTTNLKTRAALGAVALCLGGVAVVLAGVALMLWAVLPASSLQAPWALVVAPATPAVIALVCVLIARRPAEPRFAALREQVSADLVMLRQVGAG